MYFCSQPGRPHARSLHNTSTGLRSVPNKRCKTFIKLKRKCVEHCSGNARVATMAAEKIILCVLFEEFSKPDEIDINTCLVLQNTLDSTSYLRDCYDLYDLIIYLLIGLTFLTHPPNKRKRISNPVAHRCPPFPGNMSFNPETVAKRWAPVWAWTYPWILSLSFGLLQKISSATNKSLPFLPVVFW